MSGEKLPEDRVSRDRAPGSSRRGCLAVQVSGRELFLVSLELDVLKASPV